MRGVVLLAAVGDFLGVVIFVVVALITIIGNVLTKQREAKEAQERLARRKAAAAEGQPPRPAAGNPPARPPNWTTRSASFSVGRRRAGRARARGSRSPLVRYGRRRVGPAFAAEASRAATPALASHRASRRRRSGRGRRGVRDARLGRTGSRRGDEGPGHHARSNATWTTWAAAAGTSTTWWSSGWRRSSATRSADLGAAFAQKGRRGAEAETPRGRSARDQRRRACRPAGRRRRRPPGDDPQRDFPASRTPLVRRLSAWHGHLGRVFCFLHGLEARATSRSGLRRPLVPYNRPGPFFPPAFSA